MTTLGNQRRTLTASMTNIDYYIHRYHPFHSREKLDQFKKEVTGENAGTAEKLSNENQKEVELSNEKSKDKSAAAC